MPTLYLLRHAKSDWGDPGLDDHDRPLNPRGRKAAARMGAHIAGLPAQPDLVLCSTAVRTRETWALLAPALPTAPKVQYLETLYLASPRDIVGCINAVDGDPEALLVVGHNPGTETLAADLPAGGNRAAMQQLALKYPTAALTTLATAVPWSDLDFGLAELVDFVRPRDLT